LIITTEARSPRQIDDKIPKELERICLKALSKRVSARYTTAMDMAEDLHRYQHGDGYNENRLIDREPPELIRSERSSAQATPVKGSVKGYEVRGLLGRFGCMLQISIICSLLIALTIGYSNDFARRAADENVLHYSEPPAWLNALRYFVGSFLVALPCTFAVVWFLRWTWIRHSESRNRSDIEEL
jgi:hypothetical protein